MQSLDFAKSTIVLHFKTHETPDKYYLIYVFTYVHT